MSEEINLCNDCPPSIRGKCCYYSVEINGFEISLTNHPCKFLDTKEGLCTIYENRKEINPNCLNVDEMIILGTIPKECQYVKYDKEYKSRKDLRLYQIPYLKLTKGQIKLYNEFNQAPHNEIAIYDLKRSFLCVKCGSPDITEKYVSNGESMEDILYFFYICNKCNYKWSNPHKDK